MEITILSPSELVQPGESVVVVGNGESVRGSGMGDVIDGFDHVVRFNSFAVAGFEHDVGRKTTIWATYGQQSMPQCGTEPGTLIQAHGKTECPHPFVERILPIPTSFYARTRRLIEDRGWMEGRDNSKVIPSTGFLTCLFLLIECGVQQIHIVGFDHFDRALSAGRHHYWDPKMYLPSAEHDGVAERSLMSVLVDSGQVQYLSRQKPMNHISLKSRIGRGTKVWHFAVVQDGAVIGAECSIGSRAEVSSGVVIGDRTRISSGVFLAPNMKIGEGVFVGPNTTFTDDRYPAAGKPYESLPAIIEDGASIGAGCVILPGVRIGKGSLVGAGSVVTRDVPAGMILRGQPASSVYPMQSGRQA